MNRRTEKIIGGVAAFCILLQLGIYGYSQSVAVTGPSGITSGSTAISGGTDKQVLFNDAGVVQGSAGFTYTKGNDGTTSIVNMLGALNVAGNSWTINSNGSLIGWQGSQFGFVNSNNSSSGTNDTILTRKGAANFQFGATDAAAPVAQTLSVQSVVAGTSNTAGVSSIIVGSLSTGSGVSGDIAFQTGGSGAGATAQNTATTAVRIKGATQNVVLLSTTAATGANTGALQVPGGIWGGGRVFLPSITTSAGTQTDNLCLSSAGEVIADTGACLASSARFKDGIKALSDADALARIGGLAAKAWHYKYEPGSIFPDSYYRERIGFVAEDVAVIDPRLVSVDKEGLPHTVDYNAIVALQADAIRVLTSRIDELERRLAR